MGMTPLEIKFALAKQFGLSIAATAREFGCEREELSMCINRHRVYPHLREKLAAKLGKTVEQVFGTQATQVKRAKAA